MDVKRGIEFGSKSLINYLESIRTFIKTKKEIYDLAMITTNNNEEISDIISKALIESGKKIVVNLEESQSGQHELKVNLYLP
jgi:chaperonin GroEL